MEDIANDPIIAFYMKVSNSTESETEVPLFSETMLRLSFKQVFGSVRPLCPKELQLYRKLLLFNFSENYTSIVDLIAIMTCFDEIQIREYFDKHQSIMDQWHKFLKETLFSVLFKEAFHEILYEYTRRHLALFGELVEDKLKRKSIEIVKYLRFESKLPRQWYRAFNAMLQNRMKNDAKSEDNEGLTVEDLNIHNIYLDVRQRLNILVVEELSKHENECFKEPAAKKEKIDELNILKVEVIPTSYLDRVMAESQDHQDKSDVDAEAYDLDTEIQIANESDLNDEEYEFTSSCNEQVEIKQEEILQRVDIVNDDDSEYEDDNKISSEQEDNDDNSRNTDFIEVYDISKFENGETNDADSTKSEGGIINKDTALSYLAALQAYVVVNGHFQAIELLDKVDSFLREEK